MSRSRARNTAFAISFCLAAIALFQNAGTLPNYNSPLSRGLAEQILALDAKLSSATTPPTDREILLEDKRVAIDRIAELEGISTCSALKLAIPSTPTGTYYLAVANQMQTHRVQTLCSFGAWGTTSVAVAIVSKKDFALLESTKTLAQIQRKIQKAASNPGLSQKLVDLKEFTAEWISSQYELENCADLQAFDPSLRPGEYLLFKKEATGARPFIAYCANSGSGFTTTFLRWTDNNAALTDLTIKQITAAYRERLSRDPSATELQSALALVRNRMSLAELQQYLVAPPKDQQTMLGVVSVRSQIRAIYRELLGREPEPEGLGYWMREMFAGKSAATIRAAFRASPEFRSYATRSIQGLYLDLLGREADATGLEARVVSMIAGKSLEVVKAELRASNEFKSMATKRVQNLYRELLEREVTADGLAYWVRELTAGRTVGEIRIEIMRSSEFRTRQEYVTPTCKLLPTCPGKPSNSTTADLKYFVADRNECEKIAADRFNTCGGPSLMKGNTISGTYSLRGVTQPIQYGTTCRITQLWCPNSPSTIGSFVDNFNLASYNQATCMKRASEYYEWCGGPAKMATMTVTAKYSSNGTDLQSTTVGGAANTQAVGKCRLPTTCPVPSSMNLVSPSLERAAASEAVCQQYARERYESCGGLAKLNGSTIWVTYNEPLKVRHLFAGNSCVISLPSCPLSPSSAGTFVDYMATANSGAAACTQRARDYYAWCGGPSRMGTTKVTATYKVDGTALQSLTVP